MTRVPFFKINSPSAGKFLSEKTPSTFDLYLKDFSLIAFKFLSLISSAFLL